VLPRRLRMHSSEDFRRTIRRGVRAGRSTVVVHLCAADGDRRIGFVVSRAVGGAVVRNKVRRRLRGLVMEMVDTLPVDAAVVVRANPVAADAGYAELRRDVVSALGSAIHRAGRRG
jgi:ribonuclease P protein component